MEHTKADINHNFQKNFRAKRLIYKSNKLNNAKKMTKNNIKIIKTFLIKKDKYKKIKLNQ